MCRTRRNSPLWQARCGVSPVNSWVTPAPCSNTASRAVSRPRTSRAPPASPSTRIWPWRNPVSGRRQTPVRPSRRGPQPSPARLHRHHQAGGRARPPPHRGGLHALAGAHPRHRQARLHGAPRPEGPPVRHAPGVPGPHGGHPEPRRAAPRRPARTDAASSRTSSTSSGPGCRGPPRRSPAGTCDPPGPAAATARPAPPPS